MITVQPKVTPVLDPGFVPAVLWNRAYEKKAASNPNSQDIHIALGRKDGTVFRRSLLILPNQEENMTDNIKYVERTIKFMLWAQGGSQIYIAGNDTLADTLAEMYSENGSRHFDWDIVGDGMFSEPIRVIKTTTDEIPADR